MFLVLEVHICTIQLIVVVCPLMYVETMASVSDLSLVPSSTRLTEVVEIARLFLTLCELVRAVLVSLRLLAHLLLVLCKLVRAVLASLRLLSCEYIT